MPLPKPGKPETEDPSAEILAGENVTPKPVVEVEVDAITGQPVQTSKPAETSVSAEEFRKQQARMEYLSRQFERSQRDWETRLSQMQTPQPAKSPAEKPVDDEKVFGYTKAELNAMGVDDWTAPVAKISTAAARQVAQEEFKKLMAEQEKHQSERNRQQITQNMLAKEVQWVREQEPSLNDESSEQFVGYYATYNKMLQEDPTLQTNPRAPRLVYREWKAEAKTGGSSDTVDPEKERLKRVAGGVSPQGRPSSSQKTIKLTQEELDFCKEKGISPAIYATAKEGNLKEGVSA